jgi:hypothetical protein
VKSLGSSHTRGGPRLPGGLPSWLPCSDRLRAVRYIVRPKGDAPSTALADLTGAIKQADWSDLGRATRVDDVLELEIEQDLRLDQLQERVAKLCHGDALHYGWFHLEAADSWG